MSPWLSRFSMKQRPAVSLRGMLPAAPLRAIPWWSRSAIWLDGGRGCLLDASGRSLKTVPLGKPGEVPAALAALETLAPRPEKPGLHLVRLLLGAPFVRYFALPWRALPKPGDWVSLARAQFMRDGAQGAEGWRFVVPDEGWGHGRLAVAVPETLCAGVVRLCKQRKLLLQAIEPGYTYALARHARHIEDGAIAVVELEDTDPRAGIAHIGFRRDGQWAGFIALPATGDVDDVLRDAAVLCAAPPPERTYVIAPARMARQDDASPQRRWLAAPWNLAP